MNRRRSIPRGVTMLWVALVMLSVAWARQSLLGGRPSGAPRSQALAGFGTDLLVERLESQLQRSPHDPDLQSRLGLALLQLARETGELDLHARAETAFNRALQADRQHVDALLGLGSVALARHDFQAALELGERARAASPYRAEPLGILVDAYVELGRYAEATAMTDQLVRIHPNLASLSRVAYLRELHGDLPGAIRAMEAAIRAGTPGHENTLWARAELGHMHFESGDFRLAEAAFRRALAEQPIYLEAQEGMGLLAAAQGDYPRALQILEPLAGARPDPDLARILADLYTLSGEPQRAAGQLEETRALYEQIAQAGLDVTLELAAFEADYGVDKALSVALARQAYQMRPTVQAADVLSWAHIRSARWKAPGGTTRKPCDSAQATPCFTTTAA